MIDLPVYSPVEQILFPLFTQKGVKVFVKRDDLIHPYISGNKWRKLKYILRDAENRNKKHLITFGGAYSNHLLACACAAAKFGFKSTGIVRGEEVRNEILLFSRLLGMNLRFTDRESYRDKAGLFQKHFEDDQDAYFIDEGGAGKLAAMGCSELIGELAEEYDHIFCAAGTGTTAAGILSGIASHSLSSQMHIIPVLKGVEYLKSEIQNLSGFSSFEFHTDYHFGGYAKTSPELLAFIQNFCSNTGILIDPVYTGKMFYSIFDMVSKDHFKPGTKILAIHTGGASGISGMAERFYPDSGISGRK